MEEKFSSASGMLSQRPMARCFVVELRRASWLARVPLDADEPTPPRVVRYPTSLFCIKLPACQQFLQLARHAIRCDTVRSIALRVSTAPLGVLGGRICAPCTRNAPGMRTLPTRSASWKLE